MLQPGQGWSCAPVPSCISPPLPPAASHRREPALEPAGSSHSRLKPSAGSHRSPGKPPQAASSRGGSGGTPPVAPPHRHPAPPPPARLAWEPARPDGGRGLQLALPTALGALRWQQSVPVDHTLPKHAAPAGPRQMSSAAPWPSQLSVPLAAHKSCSPCLPCHSWLIGTLNNPPDLPGTSHTLECSAMRALLLLVLGVLLVGAQARPLGAQTGAAAAVQPAPPVPPAAQRQRGGSMHMLVHGLSQGSTPTHLRLQDGGSSRRTPWPPSTASSTRFAATSPPHTARAAPTGTPTATLPTTNSENALILSVFSALPLWAPTLRGACPVPPCPARHLPALLPARALPQVLQQPAHAVSDAHLRPVPGEQGASIQPMRTPEGAASS